MDIKRSSHRPSIKGPADWFSGMVRIAIQEALDGKAVDWIEKVTDKLYNAGSATS